MWAWLDLWGCTGATLGVANIGTGTGGDFGDSWCLWFWSCRCCGHSGWRLWQLCRLGGCRQWCRNARCGRSLWCGCSDSWDSVSGLDAAFTKVLSHAAVDHTITGVHLVPVFWQDMYHSGRNSHLAKGVISHNWLTSIQGCKRSAASVCLQQGGIGVGINSFMNLDG